MKVKERRIRPLVEQLEDRIAMSTLPTQEWILSDPDYQNPAFWGSGYEGSPYWNQEWGYNVAGGAQAPYNAVEFISGDVMKNVPGQNGLLFPGLESQAGDYVDANGFAIERDGFYIPSLEGIQGAWRYAWGSNFAVFILDGEVAPPPGGGGGEEPPPGGGGEEPPPEGGGGSTFPAEYIAWCGENPNNSNEAFWGSGHTGSIYYNHDWGFNVAAGASAPYNCREFISGDLMTNVVGQNGMYFPGLESQEGDYIDVNGFAELREGHYLPSTSGICGTWRYAWGSNFAVFSPDTVPAPEAPTNLTATWGNAQVSLNWNSCEGAECYRVFRNGSLVGITTNLTFQDIGLTNGVEYTYSVQAENAGGTSGMSNLASATPIDSNWVWILSDSNLNDVVELCRQAVDTGNAGTLTLENGLILYGDRYNVVGAGAVVKGVIYSQENEANGSRLSGFAYKCTVVVDALINGVWTPLTFDLYSTL